MGFAAEGGDYRTHLREAECRLLLNQRKALFSPCQIARGDQDFPRLGLDGNGRDVVGDRVVQFPCKRVALFEADTFELLVSHDAAVPD